MKLPIFTALSISILYAQIGFAAQPTNTSASAQTATSATAPTKTATVTPTPKTSVQPATSLVTQKDKVSYSIGVDLGENFKSQGIDVDPALFAKGIQDALTNSPTLISKQEMINTLSTYQKELLAKRDTQLKTQSTQNSQETTTYLETNKKKPGVVTTASGLQYKIITPGKGTSPTAQDTVTVDYKGTLINGKVFDSSYDRKQSITFPVNQVIPGWQETLQLMKPGATFEIVVPPNLAYGERGMGNVIGPNQTLLFTIHLVSVKKTA